MSIRISGLWLPLVTPFKDGAVDLASYERLVAHYIAAGVDGLMISWPRYEEGLRNFGTTALPLLKQAGLR